MKTFIYCLYCVLAAFIACSSENNIIYSQINSDEPYALINGTLIDGTGSGPVLNAVVIIQDGKITAAGSSATVDLPEDIQILDLYGGTILPGFFNTHVHSGYFESNLLEWAQGGVTTIRDLGTTYNNFRNYRPEYENQYARLISAGPALTVPNGYPLVPWGSIIGYSVSSPVDGYNKAQHLIDEGADIIKIMMESGGDFGQVIPMLSAEEASEIVRSAHDRNKLVSAHILVENDLKAALDAGADDIAHMVIDNLANTEIARMISNNVYWVPTLELWHGVSPVRGLTAINHLSKFVNAGGKVSLGTDYDGYSSEFDLGMPIREIGWMSDAGMSNMDIIVAATKNAAHVCGIGDILGTLENEKIADIIVTKGNPLTNLQTLTDLMLVIHGGEIIRDDR